MTLVDTNVLLDVMADDPAWAEWSSQHLQAAAVRGSLCINGVVYAELAAGFSRLVALDAALKEVGIALEETPREALFLAGKAFRRYRAAGGSRTGVLPDFFIGAHAAAIGAPLLTRDPRRYRTYFPTVELITP